MNFFQDPSGGLHCIESLDFVSLLPPGCKAIETPRDIPASPVGAVCTAWQIRKALNGLGLRSQVEAAVAAGSQEMQDGWEFATEFRSDDPLALAIGAALGKSPAEVHEIIANAATL